ncbi:MAG: hypothetical protein J6P21_00795 [Clostridia bacterium]|nr:hypothetical protein [Clostridia bacterium]
MKKINKSEIALLMALTLALNGNVKSNAMNSRVMEFSSGVMGNLSSSVGGPLGTAMAVSAVALFCGGLYVKILEERKEVAKIVISSLKSQGQLENIKKLLVAAKGSFEEVFKGNPQNFVGEKVKLGIDFDVDQVSVLGRRELSDNRQIADALGRILVLKNILGSVQINEQLRGQVSACNVVLFFGYANLIVKLKTDMRMPLIFDKADIPISVDFIRSKKNPNDNKENLSVICSLNFVSSKFDYSDRHNICIRMRDNKFELLVDGSSYDIDKLSKELG